MSNVYIMVDSDGIYKIGKANNVEARRAQVAAERKKKVIVYAWKSIENAIEFERHLHKKYKMYSQRGEREWFEFPKTQVHDIIQEHGFTMSISTLKAEIEAETTQSVELCSKNADHLLESIKKIALIMNIAFGVLFIVSLCLMFALLPNDDGIKNGYIIALSILLPLSLFLYVKEAIHKSNGFAYYNYSFFLFKQVRIVQKIH